MGLSWGSCGESSNRAGMGSQGLQGSLLGWPHLGSRCWPSAVSCRSQTAGSSKQKNCREIRRCITLSDWWHPALTIAETFGWWEGGWGEKLQPFLIYSCHIQHGHLYTYLCVHISKVELYIAPAHPALFACCWADCLGLLKQSGSTEWEGKEGIKFSIRGKAWEDALRLRKPCMK